MTDLRDPMVMLLVTGFTNAAMLPTIWLLYKQRKPWPLFVGIFTTLTR
jgi:hypothetical protein